MRIALLWGMKANIEKSNYVSQTGMQITMYVNKASNEDKQLIVNNTQGTTTVYVNQFPAHENVTIEQGLKLLGWSK